MGNAEQRNASQPAIERYVRNLDSGGESMHPQLDDSIAFRTCQLFHLLNIADTVAAGMFC